MQKVENARIANVHAAFGNCHLSRNSLATQKGPGARFAVAREFPLQNQPFGPDKSHGIGHSLEQGGRKQGVHCRGARGLRRRGVDCLPEHRAHLLPGSFRRVVFWVGGGADLSPAPLRERGEQVQGQSS